MGKLHDKIIERIAEKNHFTTEALYNNVCEQLKASESLNDSQRKAIKFLEDIAENRLLTATTYQTAYYELLEGLDEDVRRVKECSVCVGKKSWVHDGISYKFCPACGKRIGE